jgi:ABC-type glycerol-3-phosphate transport system substrate-binding protein
MKANYFRIFSIILLITLVGCTGLPINLKSGISPTPAGTYFPTDGPTFEAQPTASQVNIIGTAQPTEPTGGSVLRIWVPPEFDPLDGTPASNLLNSRLEQFMAVNKDIKLEVRVKDLEGEGGMLESLVAASAAAPLALPDLVLMPRSLLESATLKGLLFPYDGLTNIMDDKNWYEYARQIAHVQSGTYGIPFAGDAMALVYHPSLLETPPTDLLTALSFGEPMLFPATDPQALFTLNTYLADGGAIQDSQGRPVLDQATLANVLEFDQNASQSGLMPYWLTQYSTDNQVWEAFLGNPYPMAVTWASSYLSPQLSGTADLALAPVPTLNGQSYALASGWSWALAGRDPERRASAVKLAEFLVDKDFLAQWSSVAGYLPPRVDALQGWQDAKQRQVLHPISSSAQLMPSTDLVSSIGPVLEQAVVSVIKDQNDPQAAATNAANLVNKP